MWIQPVSSVLPSSSMTSNCLMIWLVSCLQASPNGALKPKKAKRLVERTLDKNRAAEKAVHQVSMQKAAAVPEAVDQIRETASQSEKAPVIADKPVEVFQTTPGLQKVPAITDKANMPAKLSLLPEPTAAAKTLPASITTAVAKKPARLSPEIEVPAATKKLAKPAGNTLAVQKASAVSSSLVSLPLSHASRAEEVRYPASPLSLTISTICLFLTCIICALM